MLQKIWTKLTGELLLRRGICPECRNSEQSMRCPACLGAAFECQGRPGLVRPTITRRWRKFHKRGGK